ncbi:MAG: bifunctional DNA-formamidopyrimidine glycosylase/DNA-(apurinic or apyrimidinic site) lyase [Planctomycetota bacterium]|nr:bifunctional DNA-formamidopyrimidine glycosylase/DNA-(apurinic or apyrimidinic site) lyase [Planctomycetota bacterium]
MPELPEVESVVRALSPLLTARSIKNARILNRSTVGGSPEPLARIRGLPFEAVRRQGKYIWIDAGARALVIHLRMTGWLGVLEREELRRRRDPYVRVCLDLEPRAGGRAEVLVFRDIRKFGRIWCGKPEVLARLKALAKLGPDPLELEAEAFVARLRAKRGRLKSLLLDQTFLAGVGNIYADEALFQARLHPLREASRVSRPVARELHAAVQDVLRRSIASGGTSLSDYYHPDGQPGWFQRELKVYGREGEACGQCGNAIRRIVIGQRGSWFCPRCQRR